MFKPIRAILAPVKYEVQAAGVEFIPALLHSLGRIADGVSAREQIDLERRLTSALKEISGSRALMKRAVEIHREMPLAVKRRAFSSRYDARSRTGARAAVA